MPNTKSNPWVRPDISSRNVAVLGGGVLGRRIACSWVAAGYSIFLCDLDEGQRNAAAHYIEHDLHKYGKVTSIEREAGSYSTTAQQEVAAKIKTLYWTDRGEWPLGNALSSGDVSVKGGTVKTLVRHLHAAIGLVVDKVNRHIYMTDLGGSVYRVNLDGNNKKRIYDTESAYTGIVLAHLG
jgi:hypothetical protein